MSTNATNRIKPSATARAEAAAWIARLHGPNRTPEAEAGFRRWLSEDPERAAAFELLTDTWEKSARLHRRPLEEVASWEMPGFRVSFSRAALATAAVSLIAVLGTVLFLRSAGVATGVGEQRLLALEDGSRVYLNTSTQAIIRYEDDARRVELKRGEALFEVAKNADRPFIVIAGNKLVTALGTAFVVRHDDDNFAVTLVEGKVTVAPAQNLIRLEDSAPSPVPGEGLTERRHDPSSAEVVPGRGHERLSSRQGPTHWEGEVILSPGERVTFAAGSVSPTLDRPRIDKVTAWQRGQVALDNTPLADAVAEMNRYSRTRVVVEDPRAAAIRVSGVFRAGDQDDFAQAVARTYGLRARSDANVIVLTGTPQ